MSKKLKTTNECTIGPRCKLGLSSDTDQIPYVACPTLKDHDALDGRTLIKYQYLKGDRQEKLREQYTSLNSAPAPLMMTEFSLFSDRLQGGRNIRRFVIRHHLF